MGEECFKTSYTYQIHSKIVNYIETFEEKIVYNEALFFAIAGSELIMSAVLGYWTQQIKKEKAYL